MFRPAPRAAGPTPACGWRDTATWHPEPDVPRRLGGRAEARRLAAPLLVDNEGVAVRTVSGRDASASLPQLAPLATLDVRTVLGGRPCVLVGVVLGQTIAKCVTVHA
jgi:hypothetical protein